MVKSIKAGFCIENDIINDSPSANLSLNQEKPFKIRKINAKAAGLLVTGDHQLTLSDRAAKIEVADNTRLDVELFCAVDNHESLSLKKLGIAFSRPIRLKNLFTTMDELSVLIADPEKSNENELFQKIKNNEFLNKAGGFIEKRASEIKSSNGVKKAESLLRSTSAPFLKKIANSKGWKTIVSAAEKTSEKAAEISPVVIEKSKDFLNKALEFGEETIDRAIEGLDVSKIEITSDISDLSKKKQHLRLKFTGNGILSEKLRIPLNDVELPGVFLSRFEPELANLLSQFCISSEQGTSLSKTFIGMIERISGKYSSSFFAEDVELSVERRGNRQYRLNIETKKESSVLGEFETSRRNDLLIVKTHGNFNDSNEKLFSYKGEVETTEDALISCGEKLNQCEWTLSMNGEGSDIRGTIELDKGNCSILDSVHFNVHDPCLKYDVQIPLNLSETHLSGSIRFGISAGNSTICIHSQNINLSGNAAWNEDYALDIVRSHTTFSPCNGEFHLNCQKDADQILRVSIQSGLDISLENQVMIEIIPELKTSDRIQTKVSGHFDVNLTGTLDTSDVKRLKLDFSHSGFKSQIHNACISSGIYRIDTDKTFSIEVELLEGALTADGLSDSKIQAVWNGLKAPILHVNEKQTEILLPELLNSHLTMSISEQGKVHFENGQGYFDEHFFNMLFYPEYDKEKVLSVPGYKPLQNLLENIIRTLSEVTGPVPGLLIDRLKRCHDKCAEKGLILNLHHVFHTNELAQILSLFVFDSLDETESIEQIIQDVVDAKGFDRNKTEALLERAFPEINFSQSGPLLRILDKIFAGIDFGNPKETHIESQYDEYAHRNRLLPSANQLFDYDSVSQEAFKKCYKYGGPCLIDTPATRARIYKYAAGYTVRQLEWLISHHSDLFSNEQKVRLNHLVALKRRIQKQEPRDGSFLVQDINIDYFLEGILEAEEEVLPHLSDLSGCLDDFTDRCESDEVAECFASWLTPEDIGRLLSAGVASRIQSQLVQLNQDRLLKYLVRRGRMYSLASLYEAGAGSDRILTNILMSVLTQDQSLLKTPINRVSLLSDLLQIEMPVRQDYLPGGIHAADSYFEKLYEIAHKINESVAQYASAKLRMQSDRISNEDEINEETPKRPPYKPVYSDEDEQAELVRALEKADGIGRDFVLEIKSALENGDNDFSGDPKTIQRIEKAYRYAYRLASTILSKYPDTIEKEVFRRFYARTYHALTIQVLDQNLIDDTDEVRKWFAVRSGISASEVSNISQYQRRNAIIDVLFYREEDRTELRNDPLSWIDTRPAEGPVNLTVLGAMGVITEGKRGNELRTSFERLYKTRNIKLVRTDTGNIKSLAFNSIILEDEIRQIKTPYMILGYSQGCANMMRAESNMYASTPDDRKCLNQLVARHFLYSALNGSVHAYCGGEIYRQSMIDGEKYLKTLVATKTAAMSDFLFEILRKILDSPVMTMSLNSVESLSYDGLKQLSQDAQYKPGVISTEIQGAIKEYIPESLQYLASHFDRQAHIDNDSQVGLDCSHGYHVYNRNDSVDLLRRESIACCTFKAHHWYPVYEEVSYLETEQDIRDAVFHAPKDIHIFPAIEALILFGKVKYASE